MAQRGKAVVGASDSLEDTRERQRRPQVRTLRGEDVVADDDVIIGRVSDLGREQHVDWEP